MQFLKNTAQNIVSHFIPRIGGAYGFWLMAVLLMLLDPAYTWEHLFELRSPGTVVLGGALLCVLGDMVLLVPLLVRSRRAGVNAELGKVFIGMNRDSAWNKASPEEPLFILRGQDQLAPLYVRMWASAVLERAYTPGADGHKGPQSLRQVVKATQAKQIADAMVAYQKATGRSKIPD